MPAKRVADGLGITTESLRAWRRQLGGVDAASATAAITRRRKSKENAAGITSAH